ncbi:MAG: cation diffusion facilitator family transporter [Nanoarchaeota archaeon]|nr:cation diffusion facilitator family transporter [Nanoarchaeota archaeon]MBU1005277.1 cation diffusion facilitator family transporter [Nanoarchaeota archaeon]MBU1947056.1 cation diffusion facilitator family transporter [Nanoarchaeota archaeon]
MKSSVKKATFLGIIGNIILFILKITVGLIYNSIAVISDSINSFTDIIASVIVFISVKMSSKKADHDHPFGHYRAEPIAGLIVAIFTGIVGFEVIKAAFSRLMQGEVIIKGIAPMLVMGFTLVLKSFMYFYVRNVGKKNNSTALIASATDHRNDVLISSAALIGVGGAYFGYVILDPIVALVIGAWIIYAGYRIGIVNVKYLIGEAPSRELMQKIKQIAKSVKFVKGINDVRAHYVGVLLQVEVHIEVDKKLRIDKAHEIGKEVQDKIEALEEVDRVFVHFDPVG